MAKRSQPEPSAKPQVPPDVGISLLRRQIGKAKELLGNRPVTSDASSQWQLLTRNYLEKAFGAGSPNVSSVMDVTRRLLYVSGTTDAELERDRAEDLVAQVAQLDGLVELLETELELAQTGAVSPRVDVRGHRIFLVHGHDERVLHEVARFLERLQQDVVILREEPNEGRTIIEKFEAYSDVGYAVVLLTADDIGGVASDGPVKQLPRARQNVILELGYFLGRLGRNRVCALYQEGVDIPSDYSGVLYVPLDAGGGWRLRFAKELKAANLTVDMNMAL